MSCAFPTPISNRHGPATSPGGQITPEQCRAARGWLEWSQTALAERAGVSLSTVRSLEDRSHTPIRNNLIAITSAFKAAGVDMVFQEGKPAGISVPSSQQHAGGACYGTRHVERIA